MCVCVCVVCVCVVCVCVLCVCVVCVCVIYKHTYIYTHFYAQSYVHPAFHYICTHLSYCLYNYLCVYILHGMILAAETAAATVSQFPQQQS